MFEAEYVTDVKWLGRMKQYSVFQKYCMALIIILTLHFNPQQ